MGQKAHPTGQRLGFIKGWDSNWYGGNDYTEKLVEDEKIRTYLMARLKKASVSRIVIERTLKLVTVTINTARPGVIIGKGGAEVDKLREEMKKLTGKDVQLNIFEIKRPELDARLVADSIARQLEGRISFRRAMKMAVASTMRMGAEGIKLQVSGRLNGAEIARREWYREGRVPLHTLRADIDYGTSEAKTTYGIIGIKVWVFRGEILSRNDALQAVPEPAVDDQRKPRRGPVRTKSEGESDAAPARRSPAKKAEDAKPEGTAVPTAPVKRVRKAPAKPDAAAGAAKEVKE